MQAMPSLASAAWLWVPLAGQATAVVVIVRQPWQQQHLLLHLRLRLHQRCQLPLRLQLSRLLQERATRGQRLWHQPTRLAMATPRRCNCQGLSSQ